MTFHRIISIVLLVANYYFDMVTALTCYNSQAMDVDANDIETCSSGYDRCQFSVEFGQDYWRRGCTSSSACDDGCSSFVSGSNDTSFNRTSCCCSEDNCNGYESLAAKGASTYIDNDNPTGSDGNSTTVTQSGSLRCFDSSYMEVTNSDLTTCPDSDDACSFRTKFGQDYWRRGCTSLSGCESGEGCQSELEDDGNGGQYNVTSCCCTSDSCNEYASIAAQGSSDYTDPTTTGDISPTSKSGCNYIEVSLSLWLMILFISISIN